MKCSSFVASCVAGMVLGVNPLWQWNAQANTNLFEARALAEGDVVAIAVPINNGEAYNLLIVEQLSNSRDCWRETSGTPTVVEPLLLNFDFTGICGRSTDSNGYSVRLAGEDMTWRYDLRLVWEGENLKLKAFNTENPWRSPIEVGETGGVTQGMLKIQLQDGWEMGKRSYQGETLGHIYLMNDQPADSLIASFTPSSVSSEDSPPRNQIAAKASTATGTESVQIFVPPANAPKAIAVPAAPQSPPTPEAFPEPLPSNNLPVPNVSIPTYASDASGRISLHTMNQAAPPPPPISRAIALGLKYKVVVNASSTSEKDRLKQIIPDAFHTWVGDRQMMQAGAFADEVEAQDLRTRLTEAGFTSEIISIR